MTVGGEKLLALLQEQQAHILVTSQVVKEVQRQKVKVTASFLGASVEETGVEQHHCSEPPPQDRNYLARADTSAAPENSQEDIA